MTVCIASDAFYPRVGGVAGFNRYLCDNLLSQGHHVLCLTIDEKAMNTETDEIVKDGNRTTVILKGSYQQLKQYYARYFRTGGHSAYGWIAMGLAMKNWLLKNHRLFRIDIIEIGDWGGAGVYMVHDDLPPVVVTGHSSAMQLHRFNYMTKGAHTDVIKHSELLSYRHCAGIIAHSPLNVADIHELTQSRVHFSRAPWTSPIPMNIGQEVSCTNLVVSGLQLAKGVDTMAAATALISKENKSWQLSWVGGDTYTAPGNERVSHYLSKKYGSIWNRNFVWINQKDHGDIINTIAGSSLCIIPSRWETFNYFALESAFLQKPLIMTTTTGASYLFENDDNVRIIAPDDPKALADILSDEAKITKWKKQIGTETKERITAYFSPSKIIEERMEVYTRIIKERKPQQHDATASLDFLKQYTTRARELYYFIRKTAKRIVKGK